MDCQWFQQSLKTRLGVAFGAITLLLAIMLSLAIGQVARHPIEQERGQVLAELAYSMADTLDRGMFERYRDLQIISTLEQFRNPQTPVSEQRALLETLQSTYPDYAWIGFIEQSGIVRAATDGLLEHKSAAQRPVFRNTQGKAWVGDVHEAVLLAKLLPNPSGEPLRFVDVTAPVKQNGQQVGVLAAHLSWAWARGIQTSIVQPYQDHVQAEAYILKQDGTVLLGPHGAEAQFQPLQLQDLGVTQASRAAYQLKRWPDGATYLTGVAPTHGYREYPGLGWTVVVRQPTEVAFAPARSLQRQILGWGIALGGVFMGLGWQIAGRIAMPILAIAAAADRFRWGDRQTTVPRCRGRDEVATLSGSLAKLFQTVTDQEQHLVELNQSLEQRVKARTAELNQLNAALQDEVTQRTVAEQLLRELTDALQHSNQELQQFAYVVSHDLQEPLRTVANYTQLLSRKYQGALDGKADKYIGYVNEGTAQMQQLIQDLLHYSRVGQQQLQVQSVDCQSLLQQVLRNLQGAIAESQATVTQDSLPTLMADRARLAQLFQNLMGNAIKYRGEQSPRIHIAAQQQQDEWLFSVQDNGIGIEPQYAERIFVIFQRLHTRRSYSGTGIGLAICKKIVELHQGRIWVESQPGQGSTFYFSISMHFS